MFHNYFFLKRLSARLDQILKGFQLIECYSQNKDELILKFSNQGKYFHIRANLDPIVSLIAFPDEIARASRNSIDLFETLIGLKVVGVKPFEYERSFQILLAKDQALIFKMHARRANILLADSNKIAGAFRKNLKADFDVTPTELSKTIEITRENLLLYDGDPNQLIPALGKEVKITIEKRNFSMLSDDQKWNGLQLILKELQENPIFLINSATPRISLIEESIESVNDPITAANWLYEKTVKTVFFEKEKEQLINKLKHRINKSENYIRKTREKLNEIETSRNPEELANIIMANLHHIQTGLSKIVLTDLYTNEPITIKLNTALSPQKNAENYYRRAKNRHQEISSLKKNLSDKKALIHQLSSEILKIQDIENSKDLRKFKKSGESKESARVKPEHLPYHSFDFDGWQLMVGKNSKANDELTLKVANKNDLWLHAKDVAGSHVVIRQRPGQNFPAHVIEYAAGLAAFNSKRKTDSLCPVIYTLKKYVRKAKGSPAGQVIVEKEDIIMIEPLQVN